jgi:hypothetical protein
MTTAVKSVYRGANGTEVRVSNTLMGLTAFLMVAAVSGFPKRVLARRS